MLRSHFLSFKCLKFTANKVTALKAFSETPNVSLLKKYTLKRSYATTTAPGSTKQNSGPPLGASRRVVPLPTKVTEMKLRCKVIHNKQSVRKLKQHFL